MTVTPLPSARRAELAGIRLPVPVAQTQGTLALALLPRQAPPTGRPSHSTGATVSPIDRRLRRALEEWTHRFVQAAVEIVGGDRPASQLVRWTSSDVHADLLRRAQLVARAGGHQPGLSRVQPVRPKVASVHPCFVSDAIVECSVRVAYGERSRAMAARFEQVDARWICTALDFS